MTRQFFSTATAAQAIVLLLLNQIFICTSVCAQSNKGIYTAPSQSGAKSVSHGAPQSQPRLAPGEHAFRPALVLASTDAKDWGDMYWYMRRLCDRIELCYPRTYLKEHNHFATSATEFTLDENGRAILGPVNGWEGINRQPRDAYERAAVEKASPFGPIPATQQGRKIIIRYFF